MTQKQKKPLEDKPMMRFAILSLLIPLSLSNLRAAEELKLEAPKGWTGETIKLPTGFAPTMKLKGIEVIRFAPGMFDAKSDSFFSYAFIFEVEKEPKLTQQFVEDQLLVYYRGLSTAVLKGRGVEVDTSKFTLKLKPQKIDAENLKRYDGDLNWIEPFATQKMQTLRFQVDTVADFKKGKSLMFVCVSPQKPDSKIWESLYSIRAAFYKSN